MVFPEPAFPVAVRNVAVGLAQVKPHSTPALRSP